MNIRETIDAELAGLNVPQQYLGFVDKVEAGLVRREVDIVNRLIEAAEGEGLNPTRVHSILSDAGLTTTDLDEAKHQADITLLEDRLAEIQAELTELRNRNRQ